MVFTDLAVTAGVNNNSNLLMKKHQLQLPFQEVLLLYLRRFVQYFAGYLIEELTTTGNKGSLILQDKEALIIQGHAFFSIFVVGLQFFSPA
jgi:hypothetical protein